MKYEEKIKLKTSFIDKKGYEIPNPMPLELPLTAYRPPSLAEQMLRVRRTIEDEMVEESREEALDFDVRTDFMTPEGTTIYEMQAEEEFSQEFPSEDKDLPDEIPKENQDEGGKENIKPEEKDNKTS